MSNIIIVNRFLFDKIAKDTAMIFGIGETAMTSESNRK